MTAWGSSFGDAWGSSFGGASAGVTINCNKGAATASGRQATITAGGSTTISCNVGNAIAAGLQASISVGGVADARLDQILALLTGRKVYDPATKLWRVYSPDSTELADESGVLMRGLHSWMLNTNARQFGSQEWLLRARRRGRR